MSRHQTGYIRRVGKSWYGRWYEDQRVDGIIKRVQKSKTLAEYSDLYRSKSDVQPLLDKILKPLNEGRTEPEGTLTVDKYFETVFLPYVTAELKPSTANGYASLWRMYIKPHVPDVALRDLQCKHATRLLAKIHEEHELSRKSLKHCKSLLSAVFGHARAEGAIDGINPVQGARIPRQAAAAPESHAYAVEEVTLMLNVLTALRGRRLA